MSFDEVVLYHPNNWGRNYQLLDSRSKKDPDTFGWFLCSSRIFDDKTSLYYSDISPHVQFFSVSTGKTLVARGLSKKGEGVKTEITRARLLILSDPHNKKVFCSQYKYLCGCDSDKDVLSNECSLRSKENISKGTALALKLKYDGIMIRHDCSESSILCNDMICANATFIFRKGILIDVEKPMRCGIIKYAKLNNSTIRKKIPKFPSCQEIDKLLEDNFCYDVSLILYRLLSGK